MDLTLTSNSAFHPESKCLFHVGIDYPIKYDFAVPTTADDLIISQNLQLMRYSSLIEVENITQIPHAQFERTQSAKNLQSCRICKYKKVIRRTS